jgi:outer membrane protein TolC
VSSTKQRTVAVSVLVLAAGGCSAGHYSRRADRSAQRLLDERDEAVLGDREATTAYPALLPPAPETEEEPPAPAEPVPAPAPRVLDLRQALAIAYDTSRDMIDRREVLHLQALSLSSSRHDFAPQLAMTLSYLFDDPADELHQNTSTASFTASQILATGGILTLDASTSKGEGEDASPEYGSFVSVALVQPLLRGGGYAVTHEPLIQAERNLVYAIRDFELFREDFSIDVARRFYDLVNRKQSIENQRVSLENNEFGRRQAEALFAVGRTSELDVLRARRTELTARNSLLEAEESLRLALDTFRIFLGLPEDQPVDVEADPPAFTPVEYEVNSAVEVAMENRLDLRNRREQLEDVERGVSIAKNGLLPDLDLRLGTSYATGDSLEAPFGSDLERANSSLAVTLGVPIDRLDERNAYRAAEIGLGRARRDLEQFEDQLRVTIQSSFRELTRRLESLEIQRQLIVDQTKNLRIAELRFERGELPNRDVVEARQSLLDAQNALIDEQVNYEIERLQLLRDLGILFIDDSGMWKG